MSQRRRSGRQRRQSATRRAGHTGCPFGKTQYSTWERAAASMERIRTEGQRAVLPVRVYQCDDGCLQWHLTSQKGSTR